MKNKLKILAIVTVVVAGMVLYKQFVDKREAEKPKRKEDDSN